MLILSGQQKSRPVNLDKAAKNSIMKPEKAVAIAVAVVPVEIFGLKETPLTTMVGGYFLRFVIV